MRIFVLLIAFIVGSLLFAISKEFFPPSFISGAIRSGLLFAGLYWVWRLTEPMGRKKQPDEDVSQAPHNDWDSEIIEHDASPLDNDFYAQAWNEVQSGQTQETTWARAYADAEGEPRKISAVYIKMRVEELRRQRKDEVEEINIITEHLVNPIPAFDYAKEHNLTVNEVRRLYQKGQLLGYVYKNKLFIGNDYKENIIESTLKYFMAILAIALLVLALALLVLALIGIEVLGAEL